MHRDKTASSIMKGMASVVALVALLAVGYIGMRLDRIIELLERAK